MPRSLQQLKLLAFTLVPRLVSAACECGYSTHSIQSNQNEVYTDVLESDFLHFNDISRQQDWVRQAWNLPPAGPAPWGRNMTLDDVTTNPLRDETGTQGINGGDPGLQLWVRSGEPQGGDIPGAEVASARRDMKYGSFRAGIKYTGEPGTCGAFFWYFNDTQEIDVEFLSSHQVEPDKAPVFLVIHAPNTGQLITDFHTVGFRPDQAYHEYRFDWTPESVTYYADGQFLWESTAGVPFHQGGITLNHWSNGDPGWSKGPPGKDAVMQFSYIKAYFNSSDPARQNDYKMRCHDPNDRAAICTVPDQTSPPDPSQSTTFLSPNKGRPVLVNGDQPIEPKPSSKPPSQPIPNQPVVSDPAVPSQPALSNKVSTDGSCGGIGGKTCLGSTFGDCCSSYGFCGSTPLFCADPKCQPDFGKCDGGSRPAPSSQPVLISKTVSSDGSCGGDEGRSCVGSTFGDCCSSYGFCGSTPLFCADPKCQPGFGKCDGGSQPAKASQPGVASRSISSDGTCGGDAGHTCVGSTFGDCCSSYGFCGSTALYCSDPKCQPEFGTCGGGS